MYSLKFARPASLSTCKYMYVCMYVYIYIYIYTHAYIHPFSITRFPLQRFSPGAGLLRYVFFIGSG